jgi:outer membrane protein OmpA-like peptidoglycan-associated protein
MLATQMFPDKFSQLFHFIATLQTELSQVTEDSATPARPQDAHGISLSSQPPVDAKQSETKRIKSALEEGDSTLIEEVYSGEDQNPGSSNIVLPDLHQTKNRETVEESPLLKWVDSFNAKSVKSEATTTNESSSETGNSDITSFQNIELATRYNIYFDFNRSTIPSKYEPLLKSIRNKMLLDERNFLKITGYADSQGNGNYNYRLSLKRAETVKEYFTIRGIVDDRLQVAAVGSVKRGESRLETPDTRKTIRRVEVILFPK